MARTALTDARIGALRPRKIAYDIRDGKLGGFGVRVLPSGRKRFFVHSQHRGDRVWKILGDAATMSVDEARSSAVRTLAAIRRGEDPPRGSRRDPLRGRRRDRVRTIPAALEAGNAGCQPVLPEEPDPAPLPGTASRRHRPAGRPGLVRIAARDPGRRRPLNAGALRHLEGGGSHGSFGPRAPTPAWASDATAARDARASCPTRRYAACPRDCRPTQMCVRSRSPSSGSSC